MRIINTLLGVVFWLYTANGMATTLPQPLPRNVIELNPATEDALPEAFMLLHEEERKRLHWHMLPTASVKQMAQDFFPETTFLSQPMLLTQPVISSHSVILSQPKQPPAANVALAAKTTVQPSVAVQANVNAPATFAVKPTAQTQATTSIQTTASSQAKLPVNTNTGLATPTAVAMQKSIQPAPANQVVISQVLVKRLAVHQAPTTPASAKQITSVQTAASSSNANQAVVSKAMVKQAETKEVTHRIKKSEELLRQQHALQLSYQIKLTKTISTKINHANKVNAQSAFKHDGWPKLQISQMRISSAY